jgi:molybdenum cofactor biosynthesis enzyme
MKLSVRTRRIIARACVLTGSVILAAQVAGAGIAPTLIQVLGIDTCAALAIVSGTVYLHATGRRR